MERSRVPRPRGQDHRCVKRFSRDRDCDRDRDRDRDCATLGKGFESKDAVFKSS